MSRFKRAQLVIQTVEGELVTSVLLEFEGNKNEYITAASIAWLFGRDTTEIQAFLDQNGLITRERHGQQWVNLSDVMWMFGWTPS